MTLFEVGKLADEYMADFLEQLESVNQFAEGEAQRYSEHAMALLDSLKSLKEEVETDMVRGESLLSLDSATRARVLAKSYGFVRLFYLCKYTSNQNGRGMISIFFVMDLLKLSLQPFRKILSVTYVKHNSASIPERFFS